MQFRIVSDLHAEFFSKNYNPLPDLGDQEQDMVLIVAGDLGVAVKEDTYVPWLLDMADRHNQVIYFPGNHEHYHGIINQTDQLITDVIAREGLSNVSYAGIGGDLIRFPQDDSVVVVANPLYSDMLGGNPIAGFTIEQGMNDFRMIRIVDDSQTNLIDDSQTNRKLRADDYIAMFTQAKNKIFEDVAREKEAGRKVLVATHWGPSFQSVPEQYKGTVLNGGFVSDLDREIEMLEPDVWVHGHTHNSFNYMIGNTNVICNPQGYVDHLDYNKQFDPNLIVTL